MSRKKDWLYLGLGLLSFYFIFLVAAAIFGLILPDVPDVVLVFAVMTPAFFGGAKLYRFCTLQFRDW